MYFQNQARSKVMYAIIQNGGKQYKVVEGKKVRLEKLTSEGDDVQIKEVLVVNDGTNSVIGTPYVQGASVNGKIVSHGKNRKVIIFKYKRRKDSKTKKGHRQPYTEVLVEKITMEAPHGA
jgi:large subunit ribosomal protein L21